ncbi:hypothetical protein ACIGDI_39810 [Streptomyces sp. NPDC085900]|uniref:hypothetical protein n=1 Tax=Streptomyces sp. NPDC085900 TaxID=3365737 RepID=UPI0037D18364
MTTPTAATSKARVRRRKTRTKNVNSRRPVLASGLPVVELDLTPGKECLVCPDCSTWVPITGVLGTPKLVPHHAGRAKTAEPRRCTAGSNRQVTVDIDVREWARAVAEADATATGRRSARVNRKPRTTAPVPVLRLASLPGPSARLLAAQSKARTAVDDHRSECQVCRTGRMRCPVGRELEIRMGHTDAAVRLEQEQHELALRAATAPAIPRAQQWRRIDRKKTVSRTDERRAQVPAGDAPLVSRPVPLTTLRPKVSARPAS